MDPEGRRRSPAPGRQSQWADHDGAHRREDIEPEHCAVVLIPRAKTHIGESRSLRGTNDDPIGIGETSRCEA
jgi:hypothetical protein